MRGCSASQADEDSQAARYLTRGLPMRRFLPACSQLHASSLSEPSRAMPAASAAPRSSRSAPPTSSILPPPVPPQFSTGWELWSLVAARRSVTASFPRPPLRTPSANRTAFRSLCPAGSEAAKKPNIAQQRTAPRVTLAAFHVRSRLVRARRCCTSVASFFTSPLQPSRRAPRSLSLSR